jgi:transporter family protein
MSFVNDWFRWALLSATFAALTAIFAKIGLDGVDSYYATLIRTFVIIAVLTGFVYLAGKWTNPFALAEQHYFFLLCPEWPPAPHGCVTLTR